MKIATKFIGVWLLLSSVCFAQSVYDTQSDVKPVVVFHADAATNYPIGDRVAVLLTNPDLEPKAAAMVTVTTKAEFITVQGGKDVFNLVNLPKVAENDWLLSDKPGEYVVFISLSNTGGPPEFIWKKVVLGELPGPVKPEPGDPIADFASLTKATKFAVLGTKDPITAKQLATGYMRIATSPMTLAEAKTQSKSHRYQTLLGRTGESRNADWETALKMIDDEFAKLNYSTVEQYQAALKAMAEAMSSVTFQLTRVMPKAAATARTVRYIQKCINGQCFLVPVYK